MDLRKGNLKSGFSNEEGFCRHLVHQMNILRSRGTLCDVTLMVNSTLSLPVHRCVLAASSPALCEAISQLSSSELQLTVEDEKSVVNLVEYLYSGELRVNFKTAKDLLRLGIEFSLENLVCAVKQYISESLSLLSWVDVFQIAREFQLSTLEQEITDFVIKNVVNILDRRDFEKVDYEALRKILTGFRCNISDIGNVAFLAIVQWLEGSRAEQSDNVRNLLDLITIENLDTSHLRDLLEKKTLNTNFSLHYPALCNFLHCVEINQDLRLDYTTKRKRRPGELEAVAKVSKNGRALSGNATATAGKKTTACVALSKINNYYDNCNKRIDGSEVSYNRVDGSHVTNHLQLKSAVVEKKFCPLDDTEAHKLTDQSTAKLTKYFRARNRNRKKLRRNVTFNLSQKSQNGNLEVQGTTSNSQSNVISPEKLPAHLAAHITSMVTVSDGVHDSNKTLNGSETCCRVRKKRAMTESEMYPCPLCPKKFLTCSAQRHHTKSHGTTTALLCEICGFSTRHVASMNIHKQSHLGRKLKCTYEGCKYSAIRRNLLEDHIDKHAGIKNHVCTTCGKAFSGRKHLQRHEKIHSDPHKFSCSECDYYTGRSDKFREHVKKHHQLKKNSTKNAKKSQTAGKIRNRKCGNNDDSSKNISNLDIVDFLRFGQSLRHILDQNQNQYGTNEGTHREEAKIGLS